MILCVLKELNLQDIFRMVDDEKNLFYSWDEKPGSYDEVDQHSSPSTFLYV